MAAIHTRRMMRSTSMPEAAASAGLSETARVAWPIRVRSSTKPTAAIATSATPIATKDMSVIRTGPISTTSKVRTTTFCCEAPTKNWKAYWAASARPIVTIIIWVRPRPRRRRGCHIRRSCT